MLRLIPAPLHRGLLRLVHAVRTRWWRLAKPQLTGVAMVASDIEGRLLLVRLSYGGDAWSFPAGAARRGEDPEHAARRELREETGCEANAIRELGVLDGTLFGAPSRVYVFATRIADTPQPDGREVIDARLFPPHSLPEPLGSATREQLALWQGRS